MKKIVLGLLLLTSQVKATPNGTAAVVTTVATAACAANIHKYYKVWHVNRALDRAKEANITLRPDELAAHRKVLRGDADSFADAHIQLALNSTLRRPVSGYIDTVDAKIEAARAVTRSRRMSTDSNTSADTERMDD